MSVFGRFLDTLLSPFRGRRKSAPVVAESKVVEAPAPVEAGVREPVLAAPIPEAPAPTHAEPSLVLAPEADYAPDAPRVELEEEEPPEPGEEDEEDFETDVFDGPSLDHRVAQQLAQTPRLRSEARALALSGEHRIAMSDPVGPGSLAEALAELEREGKVACDVSQDDDGAPCLLYRPLPPSPHEPDA